MFSVHRHISVILVTPYDLLYSMWYAVHGMQYMVVLTFSKLLSEAESLAIAFNKAEQQARDSHFTPFIILYLLCYSFIFFINNYYLCHY